MSKKQIENPKVFISYAWGSEDYQDRVLSFATDLMGDGVDVILDKWNLKEGNDTYAFMEQSVNDDTVTNVLLLLDPQYARKANQRTGGVGTETQIISAEIYNKVKQEKFLPIIFERNEDNSVPKPTYLKSILHFDLSIEEKYDEEYQRLVKTLYGIEVYKKPELGSKPAWVEESAQITTKAKNSYQILKSNVSENMQQVKLDSYLEDIKNMIINYMSKEEQDISSFEKYIEAYSNTVQIRDEFLYLMKNALYVSDNEKVVISKFEEICDELDGKDSHTAEICKTLLHEMFIYLIAIYYKNRKFSEIAYIFNKTYFVGRMYDNNGQSFKVFYQHNENLDNAIIKRDDQKYYSGTAKYWTDNINTQICSKHDFVFADELCYNASIYIEKYLDYWYWFPITYAYGGYNNIAFRKFAQTLYSREHLLNAAHIFGYETIDEFVSKLKEVENLFRERKIESYRYNGAFEVAPLIYHYIKAEEVGKVR